jgi:hypothetical protein
VPKIVPNDIPTDVPPIDAIDTSFQGNKNNPNGPATENIIGVVAGPEDKPGTGDINNPISNDGNGTIEPNESSLKNYQSINFINVRLIFYLKKLPIIANFIKKLGVLL